MREPGEVSEEVNGLLLGLNTEAVSKYIVTDRLVPLFQPKGDLTKCPKTLSLFLDSKESPEKRFWNEYGFSILSQDKNKFFLEAFARTNASAFFFNPESATTAIVNTLFKELAGESNYENIRHLQDREQPLYSSICSQVFSLAQVFHATGGSSDLIPWEIKLKAYFQAAQELRCGRVKGKAVPNRPILDADYVVRSGLILDTYLKDYAGLDEPSLKIIREEDDARKPTFWSNILLHTRCVLCDELFASWEEMRTHKCTKYTKEEVCKCGLCNVVTTTSLGAALHYATVCTRPVSSKCYNCGKDVKSGPCICSQAKELSWKGIRQLVNTSDLFREENINLVETILELQSSGKISFAEDAKECWDVMIGEGDIKLGKEDLEEQESKIHAVVSCLPCFNQAQTSILFPKNSRIPEIPIIDIWQMSADLEVEQRDLHSRPASRLEQKDTVWALSNLELTSPPLNEEDMKTLRALWEGAGSSDHISWMKWAVEQPSGHLLQHLYQSGIISSNFPTISPFTDLDQAREEVKRMYLKIGDAKKWLQNIHLRAKSKVDELEEDKEEKDGGGQKENKEGDKKVEDKKVKKETKKEITKNMRVGLLRNFGKGPGDDEGDDDDDEDDDDDDDDVRVISGSGEPGKIKCNNEAHDNPPEFSTSLEKIRHIKQDHPCPYAPQCHFFHEYDSVMREHVKNAHPELGVKGFSCHLCDAKYKEQSKLKKHMQKDHPECSVCKKPFSNMEALKNHQPCWEVKPGVVSKKTDNTNGLLVPIHKAELEGYRVGLPEPTILIAQGLAQLCEETALPEDSKDNVLKPLLQATALIEAQRKNRLYPFQAKAVKYPLIQPPSFSHPAGCRESNKFSEFLGSNDIKERWLPSYQPSKALSNFYALKRINDKLSSCVAACHLTRETATVLLKQRIHPETLSALEAISNTRAQDFRYENLLLLAQNTFFQISLEKLQQEAESVSRDNDEKVHDFFTRCFHLLSTAALGHDEESRSRYIQYHLRRLMMRTITASLRMTIENIELENGVEYTGSDILNFYISNWQKMEERTNTKSQLPHHVHRVERRKQRNKNQLKTSKQKSVRTLKEPVDKAKEKKLNSVCYTCGKKGHFSRECEEKEKQLPRQEKTGENKVGLLPPGQRLYKEQEVKTQHISNQPQQPVPRNPVQGMALNGTDAYKQTLMTNKRAEYAINMKAKLGLPASDMSRFCFKCGAGHERSSRPYHPSKECRLPNSEHVHSCAIGMKLLHDDKSCPYKKQENVGNIRIGRRSNLV